MSTAYIVLPWMHGDFSPSLDQEEQDDILEALLEILWSSTGHTTLVWVRAHAGDQGNEMADCEAKAGSEEEEMQWDRKLKLVALYSQSTFNEVSTKGWTAAAEKHCRLFEGQHQSAATREATTAISTDSLLTKGVG
eukprot:1438087-Rhodomonas_salina.2